MLLPFRALKFLPFGMRLGRAWSKTYRRWPGLGLNPTTFASALQCRTGQAGWTEYGETAGWVDAG